VLNDRLSLIVLYVELGDLDAARAHTRLLGELAAFSPGPREVGARDHAFGLVAIAEGRVDEGRAHLVDALRAFAPTQMTEFFLHTLNALADSIPADVGAQLAELSEDIRSRRRTMPQVVEVVEGLLGL
jgi:hypothetical protein